MQTAETGEMLTFACAADWEAWLKDHVDQADGAWLRIARKGSKETLLTISEARDVALCYGWIDSQRKGYDADLVFTALFTQAGEEPMVQNQRRTGRSTA